MLISNRPKITVHTLNPCNASFNIGKRCLSCRLLNTLVHEHYTAACCGYSGTRRHLTGSTIVRGAAHPPNSATTRSDTRRKTRSVRDTHRLEFKSCNRVYESIYRPVWSCILYSVHLLSVRIGGMWRCVYCRQDGENSDTDLVVDDENQVCTLVDGQNVYINVLACLIVLSCWKCETRTCTSTSFVRIKDMWWRLLAAVDTTKWRATREWTRQD